MYQRRYTEQGHGVCKVLREGKLMFLRSLAGESRLDRGINEEVRRRAGIERELATIVD